MPLCHQGRDAAAAPARAALHPQPAVVIASTTQHGVRVCVFVCQAHACARSGDSSASSLTATLTHALAHSPCLALPWQRRAPEPRRTRGGSAAVPRGQLQLPPQPWLLLWLLVTSTLRHHGGCVLAAVVAAVAGWPAAVVAVVAAVGVVAQHLGHLPWPAGPHEALTAAAEAPCSPAAACAPQPAGTTSHTASVHTPLRAHGPQDKQQHCCKASLGCV